MGGPGSGRKKGSSGKRAKKKAEMKSGAYGRMKSNELVSLGIKNAKAKGQKYTGPKSFNI